MPKFKYEALNSAGETIAGVESAQTAGAVRLGLMNRQLQPLSVTPKTSILQFEISQKRVPREVIMQFSRQLSVFISAGIPILEALEIILEETTDKTFKATLESMLESLQAGDTFSTAAAVHPE